MQLTAEQQDAVDTVVQHGMHLTLTALPGSGKSAVAHQIVQSCTDRCVLIVAYNRSLHEATTARLVPEQHKTVKSFTFHGLASYLTGASCHNDQQLTSALDTLEAADTIQHAGNLRPCTLLIVDECQDMRPDLFRLVQLFLTKVCAQPAQMRLVLLGDPRQLLYDFYRHDCADVRFLTLGHQLLHTLNARPWAHRQLTRSFRSTHNVTGFLNALIPGHGMRSGHHPQTHEHPVELYICNVYTQVATHLLPMVRAYSPGGRADSVQQPEREVGGPSGRQCPGGTLDPSARESLRDAVYWRRGLAARSRESAIQDLLRRQGPGGSAGGRAQ